MPTPTVRQLKQDIAPYEKSLARKSIMQIINTILPFVLLWYFAFLSLSVSYWLTLAIAVAAAGFVIRIFILFHDCCHQSLFKSKRLNEIVGTITGILTFHPYHQWKHAHSIHHATSSNLNKRGTGDVWILTVEEYLQSSLWKRLSYRLYRNPFVMFVLGPFYTMLIENRFNRKNAKAKERINLYLTNLGIVVLAGLVCWAVGWQAFLLIQLPIFYLSGAAGIWLFYVQHQFEDSYFEKEENWDYVKAAIDGSSYYKLPKLLQWLTGNIGFHHVHHLSPRVPNYYLEEAHDKTPALHNVTTITIASSLQAIRFRLWDESNKRFIGFKELKQWAKQK
ncbi:fatty acid desaturase [Paenibacillus glycanilyticus]|uniref:fatty acid desaturase n=1 Tax=Paenibacillus glycanilyticus TaxID=126569 RepID=UPI00203C723A|nr:fatty acid desaturase [Paenibacillus glycanilyticus]MCM3626794.1 fatty acid desaturase [Paenibacillus glycanilyticus]